MIFVIWLWKVSSQSISSSCFSLCKVCWYTCRCDCGIVVLFFLSLSAKKFAHVGLTKQILNLSSVFFFSVLSSSFKINFKKNNFKVCLGPIYWQSYMPTRLLVFVCVYMRERERERVYSLVVLFLVGSLCQLSRGSQLTQYHAFLLLFLLWWTLEMCRAILYCWYNIRTCYLSERGDS